MPDERFRLYGAGREPLRVWAQEQADSEPCLSKEGKLRVQIDAHPLSHLES